MSLFNDIASYWMEGALRTFDAMGRGFGSQIESDPAPVTPYEVIYQAGMVSLRHYKPEVRDGWQVTMVQASNPKAARGGPAKPKR